MISGSFSLLRQVFVCCAGTLGISIVLVSSAFAQRDQPKPPTIFWPADVAHDESIPSPKEFLGFEVGHRHLRHDQVVSYLQELARVSDRITIEEYAKTHGGRPLLLLTITSPANHARLDEIRQQHRRLSRPTANPQEISDDLPVVMNMGYGVHGDEPSATNTAPLVAHYLAAARGAEIDRILDNSVILLDPALNPDGFDRFARWANTFRGTVPNADPAHVEHNQGWPPGRVNYYWFDLNRDWLPLQHPESQGRMSWYHAWKPNVVLDFHEMGTDSTFFFQPGVPERKNPLTPIENVELTREMATYHASDLDNLGSLYFTQEVFDDFYMGKGSTYPDLHGAVGILFEQGSSRGHVQESANGLLQFSDTIRNQFTASLSSLRGASAMREKLLGWQHEFYRRSVDAAEAHPVKTYVFSLANNHSRLQAFADILLRHDIRCYWVPEDMMADDRVIKAGSLVVPAEQPEFRFLRSLVERRKQFRESVFYDVSAWTLPLAFNLRQVNLKAEVPTGDLKRARIGARQAAELLDNDQQPVAWFMEWGEDAAVPVLQELLDEEIHVRVALKPLKAQTGDDEFTTFTYGTIAIPLGVAQNENKQRAIARIVRRGQAKGVRFHRVYSGLAAGGIDLGSNNFPRLETPTVAMLVGSGVSAYQAGAAWHQMDHRIGMPVSLIHVNRAEQTDWSRYSTVILVSGRYQLSPGAIEELQRFVQRGGSLIAVSAAISLAADQILQLPAAAEAGTGSVVETVDDKTNPENQAAQFAEARKLAALQLVSGAIFATQIDKTHPLLFGFEGDQLPVFRSSTRLMQPATPQVSNPVRYLKPPLLAGYASEENQEKIGETAAVAVHRMGSGRVIMLADDPNFRAFWPATSRMFMNAIYFGKFTNAPAPPRDVEMHDSD